MDNTNNTTKECLKCKIEKEISEYFYNKTYSKYFNLCKTCENKRSLLYYKEYEKRKSYKEKHCLASKKYDSSPKGKKQRKKWLKNNRKRVNLSKKKYREKNKQKIKEKRRIYLSKPTVIKNINLRNRKRRKQNIQYKLRTNLSKRIHNALKGNNKSIFTMILLGCSIENFKKHLESQFIDNMSWENYGLGENKWNIDHVLPCELFDLTNEKQQLACFNYKNTKPMWSSQNISKSDILPNGKRAKDLTKKEKLEYLISIGYNF